MSTSLFERTPIWALITGLRLDHYRHGILGEESPQSRPLQASSDTPDNTHPEDKEGRFCLIGRPQESQRRKSLDSRFTGKSNGGAATGTQ